MSSLNLLNPDAREGRRNCWVSLPAPVAAEVCGGDEIMACSDAAKPNGAIGKRGALRVLLKKRTKPNQTLKQHLDVFLSVCSPAGLGCISKTMSGGVVLYKSLIVEVVSNKAVGVEKYAAVLEIAPVFCHRCG